VAESKKVWNSPNRQVGGIHYTAEQNHVHRKHAEQMLRQASGTPAVVTKSLREKFGIGPGRAGRLVEKILNEWSQGSTPAAVTRNRSQAIQRLRDDLQDARFERVVDKEDGHVTLVRRKRPDYSSIVRLETALMRLEGTDQPIKVDHDHHVLQAVVHVMGDMTPSEVQESFRRRAEDSRLADEARRRLPELVEPESN
jgi:hypothetical protein